MILMVGPRRRFRWSEASFASWGRVPYIPGKAHPAEADAVILDLFFALVWVPVGAMAVGGSVCWITTRLGKPGPRRLSAE